MTSIEIFGHALGIFAMAWGFCTLQIKDAKRMMLFYVFLCLFFGIHYLCLGAFVGFCMNMVGVLRNAVYYFGYNVKWLQHRAVPIVFTVICGVLGFIFRENNTYAFLMIAGLTINSFCLSFKNTQNIRKSILVTSPMVLIYNLLVPSWGGAIYVSIAILSALIGIFKNKE